MGSYKSVCFALWPGRALYSVTFSTVVLFGVALGCVSKLGMKGELRLKLGAWVLCQS